MTAAPRSARRGLLFGAGLGLAVTIAVVNGGSLATRSSAEGTEYRPDFAVPRWSAQSFDVAGLGPIADYDMYANRLYLLNAMDQTVRVLTKESGAWTTSGEFGGRGAGPGEFLTAHGIAVTHDGTRVVVSDDARLHFFTGAGEYRYSRGLTTHCRLLRPRVAAGRRGFFVSGNCYRTGPMTDTMTSVLYWTDDGLEYDHVASDVRFTRDGRTGSFMTAVSPFTESDSLHVFGTGSTDCFYEIAEREAGPPAVRQVCDIVKRRYSAPAPAALAASLRAEQEQRGNDPLFAWPDPLPPYSDLAVADGAVLLLRPFASDSLVFATAGGDVDLLVTGMDGLIACRRNGCMWGESTLAGLRLTLLGTGDLRAIRGLPREGADQ